MSLAMFLKQIRFTVSNSNSETIVLLSLWYGLKLQNESDSYFIFKS